MLVVDGETYIATTSLIVSARQLAAKLGDMLSMERRSEVQMQQ